MSERQNRRRDPLGDEVDSEGSWAISYGDMITLLLTFFILFFNVNHRENEQRVAMQESLLQQLKAVAPPSVEIGAERKPSSIEEQVTAQWGAKTHVVGERIVIEFPAVSFFDKGKTEVRAEAQKKLEDFAKLYQPYMGSNMLSIRAFTDTLQVSAGKRFHDNLELSALRAISAMRVMVKGGVPIHLMRISGNGELQTVMSKIQEDNFRVTGDPMARKVVLVIEPMTKEKI